MSSPKTNLSSLLFAAGYPMPAPNSRVQKALNKQGVARTAEFDRIKALPRRVLDLAGVQDLTPAFRKPGGTMTLRPVQSAALWEAEQANGLFGAVPVGEGKTLITLLVPYSFEAKRPVLIVPPNLRDQLFGVMLPEYKQHFLIPENLTIIAYSDLSIAKTQCDRCWRVFTVRTKKGAAEENDTVVGLGTCDCGGTLKTWEILESLKPDLIIADEAHYLRRAFSARTKRFTRFFKAHPECAFVALSGSMTDKSINDYSHLIELCLRKNSPLPNRWQERKDWSTVLDVPTGRESPMLPGVLLELCSQPELDEIAKNAKETTGVIRKAFARRLAETLGVIAVPSDGGAGMALVLDALPVSVPAVVAGDISVVEATWAWEDEEFSDAISLRRFLRQLSCGFWYKIDWRRSRIAAGLAPSDEKDVEWIEAKKAWNKAVRDRLNKHARPGMDSPMLLANAAADGRWDCPEWWPWAAVKGRYRPKPATTTVWIDEFLVDAAIAWTKTLERHEGAILWAQSIALCRRIAEKGGFPYFGAGDDAGIGAFDPEGQSVCVASIGAHSGGKNLQRYHKMLVVEPPSNGKTWQQMIGREHRQGQQSDEVGVTVCLHTDVFHAGFCNALKGAVYAEQTTQQKQKLLLATRIGQAASAVPMAFDGGDGSDDED